jgi:hypothetical protein
MSDYGVLHQIKSTLNKSMDENIYVMTIPPEPEFPLIHIDLEEVWNTMNDMEKSTSSAKIKFKISVILSHHIHNHGMKLSNKIQFVLDGKSIKVKDGKSAVLKLNGIVVDGNSSKKNKEIHHYFDALIRGVPA